MNAEPWICLGGTEVGNALRTLTYLRRGLAGPRFEVQASWDTRPTTITENDSYQDAYSDIYGGNYAVDPLSPAGLACYCAAYDDGPYESPEDDDAPWYTATRSDSGDFLGFVPHAIEARPGLTRAVTPGPLGSSLGPPRASGYVVAVSGAMYASSAAGMAYGERWLTEVLTGGLCGADPDLVLLPACPENGDDPRWRTLRHVGLIDGPVISRFDGVPSCTMQPVSFQLAAETPWLLADPIVLADEVPMTEGGAYYYTAETDDWPGDAALRISITVGGGDTGVFRWRGYVSDTGDCEDPGARPCWEWEAEIPAGHRVTIDAVDRIVEISNPATAEVVGGMERFVVFAPRMLGPFVWPEIEACSSVCVSVESQQAPAGTVLTIEQIGREL